MPSPESREDWIVREARKRHPAKRSAFLDGACGADAALRQRLESLLALVRPPDVAPAEPTAAAESTVKVDSVDTSCATNKTFQNQVGMYVRSQLQALDDAAISALGLGRYAEAETFARTQLPIPSRSSEVELRNFLEQPADQVWEKVLLAQAELGQDRQMEALKTLESALARYRQMQAKGATYVCFRQRFPRALYVHALAQPATAEGASQRRPSLAEAAQLVDELSEEAKQLHDSKELLAWIEAEQKKLSAGTPPL